MFFRGAIFMSTSTPMPVIKLPRKMHNNNNNNNNDGYNDNNTKTNNNLDYGWSPKLFLTGMWHSLATLPPFAPLPAHFVCTYRANAHGDCHCSGSTWRIPRRSLARATITVNAVHSRQVGGGGGRGCVLSLSLCMLSAFRFQVDVDGARCRPSPSPSARWVLADLEELALALPSSVIGFRTLCSFLVDYYVQAGHTHTQPAHTHLHTHTIAVWAFSFTRLLLRPATLAHIFCSSY